jgi:Peroxidase
MDVSYSGLHGRITPQVTSQEFLPFDETPGIFDNQVFAKVLQGDCALPVDCQLASDPELRPFVEL